MTAIIETNELTKRYRSATALSDRTTSVPEGRISPLAGPNGAAKTTLLRPRSRSRSPWPSGPGCC